MSYVVPSVLVYQQLANSGGVANVTPDLDAAIVGPCYNVIEYDGTSAESLITSAALADDGSAFSITDNEVNNVVNLPGQKPGQNVDEGSIEVYLNNAVVKTLESYFDAVTGDNTLSVSEVSNVCSVTSGSNRIHISGYTLFSIGDNVYIPTIGVLGSTLYTTIRDIIVHEGVTIILDDASSVTGTNKIITKDVISNINDATSTKRIEAGDTAIISYQSNGTSQTFTTTVTEVITVGGVITNVNMSDLFPGDAGAYQVVFHKRYNNQLLLEQLGDKTNYEQDTVGATGQITILPLPALPYGTVVTAEVHVAYRALRLDLSGTILDIEDINDLEGKLGSPSDRNPLALGVQLALANTTGRILAIAVPSEDLAGYQAALELAEGRRIYALVPLTQNEDILSMFKVHVESMSKPEEAMWRVTVVNTEIPTVKDIGEWNENNVNANSGNNAITLVNGYYVLTASNATFMSDGVVPGDIVHITAGSGTPNPVGTLQVLNVVNNQQIRVNATGTATGVNYYITRNLTKAQKAAAVAGVSRTLASNRVTHIPQGAGVTINGVVKYLPGYYLCCAYAGLISGLPVQQSLTNIGLAGIADVQYGNFYFTRAQLGTMAEAGTALIVQETQGSIPYTRHSLTTDMTTLYYREVQLVKNWDFLSYFFHDILKGFIGRYNITPDTLRILGQTITAGGRLLQGKILPKLGAPLLDFNIKTLKQDENNLDSVIVEMPIKMPVVLNYLNLYLIV